MTIYTEVVVMDTLNSGEDDDYLNGGKRNDSLDGGTGIDIAEFSDDFKNYDFVDNDDGSITITHEKQCNRWS